MLIRGLRPAVRDWRELTTDAIRGEWPAPKASYQTREAESGLGIAGRPYYFYVLRAEGDFGLIVFVLNESEDARWPSKAKGATPFDSGGLWWGKVVTNPALDDAAQRTFFQHHDVPLADWKTAFAKYIDTHYGTVADYLKGSPPGSGLQNSGTVLIKGNPNDKRAWTWEVRVPHGLAAGRLDLRAVYMTDAYYRDYLVWLSGCPRLTESEIRQVRRCVEHKVVVVDEWTDGSVAQAVEDQIALEFI